MKDIILFRGELFSTYILTCYLEEVNIFFVCVWHVDEVAIWWSVRKPIGILLIRKEGSYVHFVQYTWTHSTELNVFQDMGSIRAEGERPPLFWLEY